ncbi:hypothetical protein E0U67_21820 [Salmonella enterica subsp. enterica serovar Pomona]|nr:hypothetical protein [Salmonella enterica subsp. enterica serovar Pomona]
MEFSVESLLKSGFTKRELRYIYNNIYSFGGTLEEIVRDLAKRFKIFLWVSCCCIACFLFILYSKSDDFGYVFGGGVSLLIAVFIIGFSQPPVISFKCWRFCRVSKN